MAMSVCGGRYECTKKIRALSQVVTRNGGRRGERLFASNAGTDGRWSISHWGVIRALTARRIRPLRILGFVHCACLHDQIEICGRDKMPHGRRVCKVRDGSFSV